MFAYKRRGSVGIAMFAVGAHLCGHSDCLTMTIYDAL